MRLAALGLLWAAAALARRILLEHELELELSLLPSRARRGPHLCLREKYDRDRDREITDPLSLLNIVSV